MSVQRASSTTRSCNKKQKQKSVALIAPRPSI
jgi:hypothetical protein